MPMITRLRREYYLPRLEWLERRLAPAVWTWIGGNNGFWNNSNNWSPTGTPTGPGAELVFDVDSTDLTTINNLGALSIKSITVTSDGGDFHMNGGHNFTMTANGLLKFSSTQPAVMTTPSNAVFNLPYDLTVLVDGPDAVLDYPGTFMGSKALIKEGSGTLEISGFNTYLGGTQVNAGTLVVSQGVNLGNGPLSLNGTLKYPPFSGGLVLDGFTITGNNAAIDVVEQNAELSVTNLVTGSGKLTKLGAGILNMYGGTYTGETTLLEGKLRPAGDEAFGTSVLNLNGGTLEPLKSVWLPSPFTVGGNATIAGPYPVTFYSNTPSVLEANTLTVNAALAGCCKTVR